MKTSKPLLLALLAACAITHYTAQAAQKQPAATREPRIEITEVPSYDCGGPDKQGSIAGRVTGVDPERYRLVIYAHACNGVLYVQPTVASPFTVIDPDGRFDAYIHLGHTYYVLLVKADSNFKPEPETTEIPEKSGAIVAVARVRGKKK